MSHENAILALLDLGPTEMLVILVVALLIWGKRLPEVARNMGKSVSEFKKGIKEAERTGYEVSSDIRRAAEDAGNEVRKSYEGPPPGQTPPAGPDTPAGTQQPIDGV